MKTSHIVTAAATVLGGLFAAGQAQAAETAGYLLAGGGNSHYNNDCSGLSACDNTGKAFKLVGGYRFGNGLAMEAVSLDFGKSTASLGGLKLEVKAKAVGVGAAVYAELAPNWLATVRLGVASVKVKGSNSSGFSDSQSSTNAYAGLAIAYHFTPAVSAELAYDSARGKLDGESDNISAVTVGIGIKF